MKGNRAVEFTAGLFVLLGFLAMGFLIVKASNSQAYWGGSTGYELKARFSDIGSLKVRAPVTMAGVAIGRVTSIDFDPTTYQAVVTLRVSSEFTTLPMDTSASILTAGILGEKYIGLEPGADLEHLKDGDEITFTQSAIVLENLISKYLFSKASDGEGAK
jgi:phospholipid/cholesterol/gamma-HCH transport system substrate-binding protein